MLRNFESTVQQLYRTAGLLIVEQPARVSALSIYRTILSPSVGRRPALLCPTVFPCAANTTSAPGRRSNPHPSTPPLPARRPPLAQHDAFRALRRREGRAAGAQSEHATDVRALLRDLADDADAVPAADGAACLRHMP